MTGKRLPPDDPREWLNRAKSSLSLAHQRSRDIYPEDLCFQAQQAAEKAIKAVYISQDLAFPYVHDLSQLLSVLEQHGVAVPPPVRTAAKLTIYAALTRYPGLGTPVSGEEYQEALEMAGTVVSWAEKIVHS